MSYSAPFHRLVIIWNAYGDICNTTLSIVPGLSGSLPAVSDTLLTSMASFIATWWPTQAGSTPKGPQISFDAKLTSIKLNRISVAGLYADPETKEHVYPTPVDGGPGVRVPPQLSVVGTLRGSDERARAGKGRMYMPITDVSVNGLGTDGKLTPASALIVANGVATLIAGVNDVYIAAGVNAVAGIASRAGAGAFQAVSAITVGRVVDTMRSRRNKLDEDPVHATGW